MKLDHSFTVPVPVEEAWGVLLDVPRVAPCMPGATLTDFDGEEFNGTVKVKVGPMVLTYIGKGRFVERDEAARRVVIEASGRDTRAAGTAAATVTATLAPDGDSTRVEVSTDLKVTGKPAQFGRGMLSDVGGRLVGQFADRLAGELTGTPPAPPPPSPPPPSAELREPEPAAAAIVAPETQPEAEVEPIDVLKLGVGTAAARYAGLIALSAGAAVLTWLVVRALRR